MTTDAELVTAYTKGDRNALAAIYDRYADGLYDTARAMLSDSHDAADMVQDVFCIAAQRLSQLREPDRLKAWLYAILRNEVYRRSKKRRRAVVTDFQDARSPDVVAPDDPMGPDETLAHSELASLVRSAAAGLDERDRLVLELSVRQGLTGAELAAALGVSPDQSYSLVHRMRDRVEKSLGAIVVAKAGRRDCAELDALLRDWDGHFTVLVRKRVNRHIDDCTTCADSRRRLAPLALYGAAPAFVLPLGLRDRVLAATQSPPGSGSSGPWNSSGFPRAVRAGRRVGAWVAVAAAVTVVVAGTGLVLARDDDRVRPFGGSNVVDTGPDAVVADDDTPATTVSPAAPSSDTAAPVASVGAPVPTPTDSPTVPIDASPTTTVATSPSTTTAAVVEAPPDAGPLMALSISDVELALGTDGTSGTFVMTNENSNRVSWTITFSSSLFGTDTRRGSLAAGESTVVTVDFDRATATTPGANALPEGRFASSVFVTTSDSAGDSTPATRVIVSGVVARAPVLAKLALAFGDKGCATLRIQVAVTEESALARIDAVVTSAGVSRTVPLVLASGTTWVGSISGAVEALATGEVRVTAVDAWGRSASTSGTTTRPTSC